MLRSMCTMMRPCTIPTTHVVANTHSAGIAQKGWKDVSTALTSSPCSIPKVKQKDTSAVVVVVAVGDEADTAIDADISANKRRM